ncbi:MAG TPA: NUDIX domain-containing protein [Bauldia sp.]|nr:NUDIX domain-containing protein [Bauldia sp.]
MTGNSATIRPVLGVSALVVDGTRVLLVKRGKAPLKGCWSLPGGHLETGETLAAAAAREVAEETGIAARGLRQIETVEIIPTAASSADRHIVLVVFRGEGTGTPVAGDDAAEARWVPRGEVAGLHMVEETKQLIARHA